MHKKKLARDVPPPVRQELCAEVGFRCPVRECGSPYLTIHHFDPPWRTEHHHRPQGMIALCAEHAAKADGDYYPKDYLHSLKVSGLGKKQPVEGRFDYLRRSMIFIVGGGLFYETPVILQFGDDPYIYWHRDADGYMLLTFNLPNDQGKPACYLKDNFWQVPPGAANILCPARGRSLSVDFSNGDQFRARFRDVASVEELNRYYPWTARSRDSLAEIIEFPSTAVEMWATGGGYITMTKDFIMDGNRNVISHPISIRGQIAFSMPPTESLTNRAPLGRITLRAIDKWNANRADH